MSASHLACSSPGLMPQSGLTTWGRSSRGGTCPSPSSRFRSALISAASIPPALRSGVGPGSGPPSAPAQFPLHLHRRTHRVRGPVLVDLPCRERICRQAPERVPRVHERALGRVVRRAGCTRLACGRRGRDGANYGQDRGHPGQAIHKAKNGSSLWWEGKERKGQGGGGEGGEEGGECLGARARAWEEGLSLRDRIHPLRRQLQSGEGEAPASGRAAWRQGPYSELRISPRPPSSQSFDKCPIQCTRFLGVYPEVGQERSVCGQLAYAVAAALVCGGVGQRGELGENTAADTCHFTESKRPI